MSPAPPAPLAGWYVISLRPLDQHAAVRRAARRWGAGTFAVSTLRLLPLEAADFGSAVADSALVIATSPAAVRFAARQAPLRQGAGQRWFAVGPGTAAALRRAGIRAPLRPEHGADSAALLAHPALANVDGRRIALLTAPGGRDLLAPTLRARGARVLRVDVYRRAPLPPTPARRRALMALPTTRSAVLLSSGEALANLWRALDEPERQRLRRCLCVAASARLATMARELGFTRVCQADDARPPSLMSALAAHVQGRFR